MVSLSLLCLCLPERKVLHDAWSAILSEILCLSSALVLNGVKY